MDNLQFAAASHHRKAESYWNDTLLYICLSLHLALSISFTAHAGRLSSARILTPGTTRDLAASGCNKELGGGFAQLCNSAMPLMTISAAQDLS